MNILKDIKADYSNVPQDIVQTEFQEMLAEIKTQSDAVQAERPVTETDMASIVASILSGSGMVDLDETEMRMFNELFKHILERTASNID